MSPSVGELDELQRGALGAVDDCVVGAFVANAEGRIFAHKRSPHRKIFPNFWDIVGGHVEPGESLLTALQRETLEETGWRVQRAELIHVFDWAVSVDGRVVRKREFDFFVEVDGDLSAPRLEVDKHTEYRWFGRDDLEGLLENRPPGDTVIRDLVAKALVWNAERGRRNAKGDSILKREVAKHAKDREGRKGGQERTLNIER